MDTDRFDRLTQRLTAGGSLSRRGLSGLAATAAALTLNADAAAKKKKKKKKKPIRDASKCRPVCPQGADYCTDDPFWSCGRGCACATGTSRTICAPLIVPCIGCQTDAECDELTGPGSVCSVTGEGTFCDCNDLTRVCLPPCAEPIPVTCS